MKRKIILSFFLVAITILIIYSFEEDENQIKMKLLLEGSTFKDTYFVQKKDGEVRVILQAAETFIADDGKLMELKDIIMNFPEKDFKVTARKGYYYQETGDLYLKEGIEGNSKDITIVGTEAYWKRNENTLYSEKPLTIIGRNFSIEGNSGKAKADLIELNKGVKAVVYSKK